jgi:hypothetical protein
MQYMQVPYNVPVGFVPQTGEGWGDFTRWVRGAANTVGNFVKKNHVISTAAGLLPGYGKFVAPVARMAGLGKRRARPRAAPVRRFNAIHV